jgi:hypothetical protein
MTINFGVGAAKPQSSWPQAGAGLVCQKRKQAHGVVRPNEPQGSAVGQFVGSRSIS